MWQDWYFAIQNVVFAFIAILILIDVRNGERISLWASGLYVIVQSTSSVVSYTMGYYLMAIPFNAVIWALILYYSSRIHKRFDPLHDDIPEHF